MTGTSITYTGLSPLTSNAIGATAIIITVGHGTNDIPAQPTMARHDTPPAERIDALSDALNAVKTAATDNDPSAVERPLLRLAALAGLWVDNLSAGPDPQPATAPSRTLTRRAAPSDPGLTYDEED